MVRNSNPFTARRKRYLLALSEVLREVEGRSEHGLSAEYRSFAMKQFGVVPKLRFLPHGSDVGLKAEVMRRAGLGHARRPCGKKGDAEGDDKVLARRFEAEWNCVMHQLVKAARTLAVLNFRLSKPGERLAEPVVLVQRALIESKEK